MAVTKGEFAKMTGRTPARVSQWIAEGKIHGAALVGEGRSAKIDPAVALEQLGLSLDLGQQLAQERPIIAGTAQPPRTPFADDNPSPIANDGQARLLRARAEQAEVDLAMSKAKHEAMVGRWIEAAAAAEAWSQQLAQILQGIETWLVTSAANEVAAMDHHGAADVAKVLRAGFRSLRERLAADAAADAADLPEFDDEPGEPGEPDEDLVE